MAKKKKNTFFNLISLLFTLLVFFFSYPLVFSQSAPERLPKEIAKIRLPKLIDFGANKCIPCKKMVSILQELSEEYKVRVFIKVIGVYQERELTRANQVRLIPTQIFFNAKNEEVYRHADFMDKEQIKKVFNMMGVK